MQVIVLPFLIVFGQTIHGVMAEEPEAIGAVIMEDGAITKVSSPLIAGKIMIIAVVPEMFNATGELASGATHIAKSIGVQIAGSTIRKVLVVQTDVIGIASGIGVEIQWKSAGEQIRKARAMLFLEISAHGTHGVTIVNHHVSVIL
jgi:hypothetical protein